MKQHNKLIRDRILEIISNKGAIAHARHIDTDEEFIAALTAKLVEEANEVLETPNLEELADIKEVLDTLMKALGYTHEQLEEARRQKAMSNGGFDKRIFLISTEG